jgi:hypothetical protein
LFIMYMGHVLFPIKKRWPIYKINKE